MGGFPGKKKLSLSNELKLVEKLPLFPHSLCLIGHPAHSSRSSDIFFFVMLTPSKRRGNQYTGGGGGGGGGGGATAAEEGWLVSPSGSEWGGDWWPRGAELCADMSFTPSPLDILSDTQPESKKVSSRKKGSLQGKTTFACHQILKYLENGGS